MNIFLYYVLPFIFVLGVLIFFHELGHFLVAKYFGVKVLKFSLGFGPKLTGKKIGDTEYLISTIPLGGYVKMLGEHDEDEPLSASEAQGSFSNKHVLKRMAIVAAGPLFNLFLALLIFCLFYLFAGVQEMTTEIGQVTPDSPAFKRGIQKGDHVVSISGVRTENWTQLKDAIKKSEGETFDIIIRRGDETLAFSITPEISSVKNIFGEEKKSPLIGIVASGKLMKIDLGPIESIQEGFKKTWEIMKLTCLTIVKLFQRIVPIKMLGGPLLIGQMTGQLAQENWAYLIPFMAVISINLGILNLLPVPILDGGLIFFLILEFITGKPLSIKKREWAQKVGLFLLITLMVIVIFNDVTRLLE